MKHSDVGPIKKCTTKDFEKLAIFVGKIQKIERHPKRKKYYIMDVDCAAQDEDYQVVEPLADSYKMNELLGKEVVIVGNLKPIEISGVECDAMMLCAKKGKKLVPLTADKQVPKGAQVRGFFGKEYAFKDK